MHGLQNFECFLVLLSIESSKSKWVRHELDTAMVQKLEGVTRVIPLIMEPCEIPQPLKALLWVDMSTNFDGGVEKILHAVHGISARPPLGVTPSYITDLSESVGGLSKLASTLGKALLIGGDGERGSEATFSGKQLKEILPILTAEQVNDAVDELEEYGLVQLERWSGTAPFHFGEVRPTYALFLRFASHCPYDPEDDIKVVAAASVTKDWMNANDLRDICDLSPLRINRAIQYLADYDYIEVLRFLGTAPSDFRNVRPTRKTRQFVAERCK